ncbi:Demethylsterigmatocystin 6-O-methyltransferase protein [Rutstroemia sp. NJR-2017a WRK4]|nr:Demethylsterigmatocystin 6-O-methyltransferase protein [Rutstroemia sp. NJR-2017a WRK4]
MQDAIRDFCMFPIGGLERNEKQWSELLRKIGLKIKKIWRGSEPEACVEWLPAKLPQWLRLFEDGEDNYDYVDGDFEMKRFFEAGT